MRGRELVHADPLDPVVEREVRRIRRSEPTARRCDLEHRHHFLPRDAAGHVGAAGVAVQRYAVDIVGDAPTRLTVDVARSARTVVVLEMRAPPV